MRRAPKATGIDTQGRRAIGTHLRTNVVGYLALFVALGGTGAWAADKITSKEIAKGAVRSKHIKDNSVKTAKIADGAVTALKLAHGVGGLQGPPGPAGPKGERGPQGPPGADGTARAYARVRPHANEPCDEGPFGDECIIDHAKGVAAVYRTPSNTTGMYCVEVPGISSGSVAAAVTVDYASTNGPEGNASAQIRVKPEGFGPCSGGAFEVVTHRLVASADSVLSDSVGFTSMIP